MIIPVSFYSTCPEFQKQAFYARFKDLDIQFEEQPNAPYLVATPMLYSSLRGMVDFYSKAHKKITILDLFAEACTPDFNWFDYAIGMDYMEFGDRMVRLSSQADLHLEMRKLCSSYSPNEKKGWKKHFCNFIYTNPKAHPYRDLLFHRLSEYQFVHSLGYHLNNTKGDGQTCAGGNGDYYHGSIELKRPFKFSIAAENALFRGYTSEKIATTFLAGSVPIYWGNPDIEREYNGEAFINCHRFKSLDEVVEYVRYVDTHDDVYMRMLSTPCRTEEQEKVFQRDYAKAQQMLKTIFTQDVEEARRKGMGTFVDNYRNVTALTRQGAMLAKICSMGGILSSKLNFIFSSLHR